MNKWFSKGKKALLGALLVLGGAACTAFGSASGAIGYVEYGLYILGLFSFANLLFSVISKKNIPYLPNIGTKFVFAYIALGLFVQSAFELSGAIQNCILVVLGVLLWIVEAWFIEEEDNFFKRVVLGFLTLLLDVIIMVGCFVFIAFIRPM